MLKNLNIPLFITFTIIALFFARAVKSTSDTYWHMAIGRQIAETHQIPTEDKFVYSATNTHFTSTEWLYGLTLFTINKFFGFAGIVILRVLLILAICLFLYKTFNLLTENLWIKISLLFTVSYSLAYRFYDRPENFSYLFIALISYLLIHFIKAKSHSKLLYLTPIIFLIWPNVHPFGLIGFYLMTTYMCLERQVNLKKINKFLIIYRL